MPYRKLIWIVLLLFSSASLFAATDVMTHATPGSVRIEGRLGKKLDLCYTNRLLAQDIEPMVAPYRIKQEIGGGDWRCEYWGKWYTSLALADAYKSTANSQKKINEAAKALIDTAAADGYLGTRAVEHRTKGWDVWGCKYALLGVLAYYDRTHDASALQAACRHADVLISEFGPGKTNIADVGEWNGLPASSVLEPIVLLYERTHQQKYLDFAQHIVDCWSKPSSRLPNGMRLVEDALSGTKPVNMCAPKAYEMMSCFEGLCELYRVTANRKYLDAAVKLADGIRKEEATIVGVGTRGEVWYGGATDQTNAVEKPMETCVTVTWMKFCDQLLRLTGDVSYADELEKNLYNGLLGSMMPDGKWWAYFGGLMGFRVPSYIQHADVKLSCCVVNGPRALMLTPQWAFMNGKNGPVINLYSPSQAKFGDIKVKIMGDYPVSDKADIVVQLSKPKTFTMTLRMPSWSHNTTMTINGRPYKTRTGYMHITRLWSSGDRIQMHFDMSPQQIHLNGYTALQRGPVVLALDNRIAPPSSTNVMLGEQLKLKANPKAAKKIGAWMAFDINGATFCDYASAGNGFSQDNIFRTWLPQPCSMNTVYNTGYTAISQLSHSPSWTNPPVPLPRVTNQADDLALQKGVKVASDSEYSQERGCTSQLIDGVISTPTDFTNRWHSSVETPHPHWVEVRLPKPQQISTVTIRFADPSGYPVEFTGMVETNRSLQPIFHVTNNDNPSAYSARFKPVVTDRFRLVIAESSSTRFPNAAQISEIEIYK